MKCCALLLSLLLCLGLTGCAPTETEIPAMPVQAAETIEPEEVTADPLVEVQAELSETPKPEDAPGKMPRTQRSCACSAARR